MRSREGDRRSPCRPLHVSVRNTESVRSNAQNTLSVISRNLTPQQLSPAARMGYKILRAVITISRTDADVALNKDKKKAGRPGAK